MTVQYIRLDDVESTNSYAKSLVNFPGDGLVAVVAKRQTRGRGRGFNTYFSDHTGGLWVSIVTPITDISTHFEHNRAISLAVLDSLKNIDADAAITVKWPNDIFWGDKKICGILLENILGNQNAMVVGFGVNVNIGMDDFPEDLRDKATSVLAETGSEQALDGLLGEILTKYQRYIGEDQAAVHQLYTNNLYKRGRRVTINGQSGTFFAVDPDGRLRLDTGQGHAVFSSGSPQFDE